MKNITKILAAVFAVAALATANLALAEDKAPAAGENHEQHHPEGQAAKEKPKDSGMKGGGMNMEGMMGMMHECMSAGKDGKMCDHETMQKCQEKMGKGDCQKMMKQAKAKDKSNPKK